MATPLIFEDATALCYRIFDIAREIDLEKVRALVAADARRLRLTRAGSEYLQLPNPPLTIEMGKRKLALAEEEVEVEVSVRVFEYGAASVILRVPVAPRTTVEQLVARADELYDSQSVEKLCLEVVEQLRASLASALEESHLWSQNESYTVLFVKKLAGNPTAAQVLEHPDLARLLLGETGSRPLSHRERRDVLEHHFSYTDEDLVVIDWNAAFVYEPSGSMDIPDLLEIANAQLLELRYFDDVLDVELQQTYSQMSREQRKWYSIFHSPYRALTRKVSVSVLELAEFIERVENSLKIVGDFYLAKVYEAAVDQLRVRAWQHSVTRKQRLLAQTYSLLKGEVDTDRSHLLELGIIVLIVVEAVVAAMAVVQR